MSNRARNWARVHVVLLVIWVLLVIPSVTIWAESLLWVIFMSLYAIISTHWAAWQASKADQHSGS